jgi:hypothetical protein
MQIVDEQFTNDKATDFMAILTAIKAKAPDSVFYGGMDPQAGPMLRQMEQLGMGKVKYFGGDGICTSEIAKLAAGAKTLENVVCAEGGASLAKMPGGTAWKKRYDEKYPGQFQVYSPYTYDATFVLVDAMKRANSIDPKKYIPELKKSNFKGVTSTIAFEANGEIKNPASTLYVYKDGKKTPPVIKDFTSLCTEVSVHFTVVFPRGKLAELDVEKVLKLTTTIKTSNIHMFDDNCKLKKFENVDEIIREYYAVRLTAYRKRKAYLVDAMTKRMELLSNKARYIEYNLIDKIDLRRKSAEAVDDMLSKNAFIKIDGDYKYLVKDRKSTRLNSSH